MCTILLAAVTIKKETKVIYNVYTLKFALLDKNLGLEQTILSVSLQLCGSNLGTLFLLMSRSSGTSLFFILLS